MAADSVFCTTGCGKKRCNNARFLDNGYRATSVNRFIIERKPLAMSKVTKNSLAVKFAIPLCAFT
ncbi:MAG: hypothetical protein PVG89_17645, partial [Gammaproteobacteria bacterium]